MNFGLEIDLFKARPHKYIKRTGTPGSYKYWYKLPDGSIVEGDDAQQKTGRYEHALRLLVSRKHGKHNLTNAQIVERTGYLGDVAGETDAKKRAIAIKRLNGAIEGMKKRAGQGGRDREEWHVSGRGHDWEDTHLHTAHEDEKEAVAETPQEEATPQDESITPESTGEAAVPAPARTRSPRATTYNGYKIKKEGGKFHVTSPEGVRAPHGYDNVDEAKEFIDRATRTTEPRTAVEATRTEADAVGARNKAKELAKLEAKLQEQFGITIDEPSQAPVATSQPEEENQYSDEAIARRRSEREAQGISLDGTPERSVARARTEESYARAERSVARRRAEEARALAQESGPDAPLASEVHSADPILASDDEPVRRMIEAQARGENPYLIRAKEISERMGAHLDPKMNKSLTKLFNILEEFPTGNIEAVKARYDSSRPRGDVETMTFSALKTGMSGYKGIYMEMEELVENKPLNPEVERMKRGYARKQFERMKPFIKDSWTQSNQDAPPPYPTWGDLKTWGQVGGAPEWSGRTDRGTAVPREVHDAAPIGADGKPLYPPKWFPIHLQPAWNFLIKSAEIKEAGKGKEMALGAYAGVGDFGEKGKISGAGSQLAMDRDLESHFLNSVRKYIQGRGGVEQLIDIPSSKMTGNLSYEDIFKADFKEHDLSDLALKKIMRHKIIDPIAIAPFIKEELNNKIKRSFQLVIDPDFSFKGENLIKSEKKEDLIKSELIKKIMAKKNAFKAVRIRG